MTDYDKRINAMGITFPVRIAYDCTTLQPGCAIVQAALSGDRKVADLFDASDWLTSITPDMKVYRTNREQLKKLLHLTEKTSRLERKLAESTLHLGQ